MQFAKVGAELPTRNSMIPHHRALIRDIRNYYSLSFCFQIIGKNRANAICVESRTNQIKVNQGESS